MFAVFATVAGIVPVFLVSRALQPMMGEVIAGQGSQYFAFLLVGTVTYAFLPVAVQTLPGAIGSSLNTGTLEVVLGSPTPVPALLTGLVSYSFLWTTARSVALISAGWLLGAAFAWQQLPVALLILVLIVLSYVCIGLTLSALFMVFRTTGPLPRIVLLMSSLLGGVYYPTHVIPSWLEHLSAVFPLTYGLRALRRVLLDGASVLDVGRDLATLLLFLVVLFAVGTWSFTNALRHARQKGTLGYY